MRWSIPGPNAGGGSSRRLDGREREEGFDDPPAARLRASMQRPVAQRDALAHPEQSVTMCEAVGAAVARRDGRRPVGAGAATVVAHDDLHAVVVVAERDLGDGRPRMLAHVGERFLDDAVGLHVDRCR